jgi:AraC family transcriptional activator of tynA and feaB
VNTVFSTSGLHVRDRFDSWLDVACRNIVGHDSRAESRQTFRAELQSGSLSDIGIVIFENSPMTIAHTARHIARANSDELFVCRQVAGGLTLEQNSREVALQSGDVTLIDPRLPYAGKFFGASKLLVFKIPRRLLEARVGKTLELTARCIKPFEAESGLTSAFLAMLPTYASALGPEAAAIVKDQVLDLIGVSLAKTMRGRRPRVSSCRSIALVSVRAAIGARLTDPNLDAATVAAAAGISVRYANAVLAGENTSIMRLIQSIRLAHCRNALADTGQRHRMVSEIAYSWGFSDMTHFGRKFRAAYGVLPSDYRRLAKTD